MKQTDGAGLFYTSVKEEKNLDLLYKYIVHKLYDFQFTLPALVVEKDAVFMWVILQVHYKWLQDTTSHLIVDSHNHTSVEVDNTVVKTLTSYPQVNGAGCVNSYRHYIIHFVII